MQMFLCMDLLHSGGRRDQMTYVLRNQHWLHSDLSIHYKVLMNTL